LQKGPTTSHVSIEIGGGVVLMASITNEAVADLALKEGAPAYAVIKASDVMVGSRVRHQTPCSVPYARKKRLCIFPPDKIGTVFA
jgi:molybdopterin-binding protein